MGNLDDLPARPIERAQLLENILIERATSPNGDDAAYRMLRSELLADDALKDLAPDFVRTCRSLTQFWPYIRDRAGTYADRKKIIGDAFTPLMDHLEGRNRHPVDKVASDAIETFDPEGVHAVWQKALSRRASDPEGAITIARTLLEMVCKHILDARSVAYNDKDDLPVLYRGTATVLNLAPSQHTEEPIKAILGGAMNVVNGIGTLRNRLSDSHGRGAKLPVKPSPRHASLAVNVAGAMATFLIETHLARDN